MKVRLALFFLSDFLSSLIAHDLQNVCTGLISLIGLLKKLQIQS